MIWAWVLLALAALGLVACLVYFLTAVEPGGGPSASAPQGRAAPSEPGPTPGEKGGGDSGDSTRAPGRDAASDLPAAGGNAPASPSSLNPAPGVPESRNASGTNRPKAESPAVKAPSSGVSLGFLTQDAADEVYCSQVEESVADFFAYLDKKGYGKSRSSDLDACGRFKRILKRLEALPPVPAGEGSDPRVIIRNLYHFFRVLNRDDLGLIKEVTAGEFDTLDANLELFYRWLTLGDRCPDPEGLRPSLRVMYRYAGFFLNTTGGRAYLFRRSPVLRILVEYYSVLIVYWADRAGLNEYGVDPVPTIRPLEQEILRYPELRLQQDYLDTLGRLERYYAARR
jgi:hypothetical protein